MTGSEADLNSNHDQLHDVSTVSPVDTNPKVEVATTGNSMEKDGNNRNEEILGNNEKSINYAVEEVKIGAMSVNDHHGKEHDDSYLHELDMDHVRAQNKIYSKLYLDYPTSIGKAVSKKERQDTHRIESFLIYGEITFETFGIIIEKIKSEHGVEYGILQAPGGTFYDIGSGTGKPVFAAALLHDFSKVCGIEILEGLHKVSQVVLEKWDQEIKLSLPPAKQQTSITFIRGDATDAYTCNWSDGDIIFANSTCFDDSLMRKIADKADRLKIGSIVITLTKKLPSDRFRVLESKMLPMSWGSATIHIQQRVDPNPTT